MEINGLDIVLAAKIANVSTVTIRNWIKTGYLTLSDKGFISQESFDYFMLNVAGKEKLNSRANKLLKDQHNHKRLTDKIKLSLKNADAETLGHDYESCLSNSFRNKEGIYYTPSWIVQDMFKNVEINSDSKFLDPCCGSGNFIIQAIRAGVSPENVYGFDIDENAVLITKERIRNECGLNTQNIKVGNFLVEAEKLKFKNKSFDLIFTNPPWGKKIDKSDKKIFSRIYDCGNSLDTTSLFLGASLSILEESGVLGFLIQEAFFNITTFKDIRARVLGKNVLSFVDYGKPFKGLLSRAQAIVIRNTASDKNALVECRFDNLTHHRSLRSFMNNPKCIFNFLTCEEESKIIDRLYSVNHINLKDKAKWALGIVTGNNQKYCSLVQKEDYFPIYKGADITKTSLKIPSNFIYNDFSKLQQVAPLEMYLANEKLIYKFISTDLCFYYDNKQSLILNSANVLIPVGLDITAKQLAELLNSEIINWLFKKLFSTHKVLRGDLELLPIHTEYFLKYKYFSEEKYLEYLKIKKIKNGNFKIIN